MQVLCSFSFWIVLVPYKVVIIRYLEERLLVERIHTWTEESCTTCQRQTPRPFPCFLRAACQFLEMKSSLNGLGAGSQFSAVHEWLPSQLLSTQEEPFGSEAEWKRVQRGYYSCFTKAALPERADNAKRCQAAWSEVEDMWKLEIAAQ